VGVASGYSIFQAFGVVVPFWDLAALMACTTLAVLIPISFNGLGVTEGIFVAALAAYGNGTEQVLTACLAGRLLSLVTLLAGSAAFWFLRWQDRQVALA
jgi:uncharacterized membrane protein YbhN (UPF0104 family)